MKTTSKVYLILSLILSPITLFANVEVTNKLTAKVMFNNVKDNLNEIVAEHVNKKGFEGTIIVSNESGAIYQKSHGEAIEGIEKYDSSTPVDIASVSKQFTAASIMKLVEQGKLNIQDPISKYIKGIPKDKSSITIHNLSTNTAGFKRHSGRDENKLSKDEFIRKVMKLPLAFQVDEKYHYSNIGYGLLAYIVEETSGVDFETYLYENLLKPSGMHSTGYLRPTRSKKTIPEIKDKYAGFSNGIEMFSGLDGNHWNILGGGGIYSTAEDMQRWHTALMAGNVLSPASQAQMYKPHVPEEDGYYYGYGWSILPKEGKENLVWHNGFSFFGKAEYWRLPESGMMIFVASHKRNVSPWHIANDIYNALYETPSL